MKSAHEICGCLDGVRCALTIDRDRLMGMVNSAENRARLAEDRERVIRTAATEYLAALRREQREVFGDDDAEIEALLDAMCGDDEGSKDVQVKRRVLIAMLDAQGART